jgi:succinate-semialdehyde dehydrogenase/glutarate-semialdehyde dehydrogenase
VSEFVAVDPATGTTLGEWPASTSEDMARAIAASHRGWLAWRDTSFAERSALLHRLAERLAARADADAVLMAREMGKPVAQGRAEIDKCAWACRYAADHAAAWLADEPLQTEARSTHLSYAPVGPVLAIMPWNFPYWQVFRFAASALMAGNSVILKHAPNVPGCAAALETLFSEANAPEGLFVSLFAPVSAVGSIIADPRVRAVTLTGSTRAGRAVAALCGQWLKPSVLELGGSDPFLVLADADVEAAAATAARARLQNNGQSCIASKRFIVEAAAATRFLDAFQAAMSAAKLGDPQSRDTAVGPMARRDLRDELAMQVRRSMDAGARCLVGGAPPDRDGWWMPPTLLADCGPGMPAWDEETFGPVAAVCVVPSAQAAVDAANASPYGLGATIWTGDPDRGRALAKSLRAGAVFVNDMVRSDPRVPFGGIGDSGWGKELGREGMRQFTIAQTVWVGGGR